MFRIEGASAMRIDVSLRQQIQNGVVRQRNDFIDLVGRAKTIEEMNNGTRLFSVAICEISAKSCASCTLLAQSIAQPV